MKKSSFSNLICLPSIRGPISEVVLASSKISKSNTSQPIEIDADQGIEWLSEDKVYLHEAMPMQSKVISL